MQAVRLGVRTEGPIPVTVILAAVGPIQVPQFARGSQFILHGPDGFCSIELCHKRATFTLRPGRDSEARLQALLTAIQVSAPLAQISLDPWHEKLWPIDHVLATRADSVRTEAA